MEEKKIKKLLMYSSAFIAAGLFNFFMLNPPYNVILFGFCITVMLMLIGAHQFERWQYRGLQGGEIFHRGCIKKSIKVEKRGRFKRKTLVWGELELYRHKYNPETGNVAYLVYNPKKKKQDPDVFVYNVHTDRFVAEDKKIWKRYRDNLPAVGSTVRPKKIGKLTEKEIELLSPKEAQE